jgi:oligopeptide/dipeptide ABC transporter ATP-binding protein
MRQHQPDHPEDNAPPPVLETRKLGVELLSDDLKYPIIRDVTFSIGRGRVLALVGESGSGKTVTALAVMRLLAKNLSISSGQVFLKPDNGAGVDIARLDPDGREVRLLRGASMGMIFQEPMSSFSPLLTIGSQITDVVAAHEKISHREALDRTIALLHKVGIPNPPSTAQRYAHEFSGGMRQRAMIARALICNPDLLIADEPTTALDVTIQAQILGLIRSLQQEMEMAVLFITHDLGVVAQVADDVAVMYGGRIVEIGPVDTVFHTPLHPYTRGLMQAVPKLGATEVDLLPSIRGTVPVIFDMPAGCAFHPRCPLAVPGVCDTDVPHLVTVGKQHQVRCVKVSAGEAGGLG